jgi:tetratricopeptide (TPR) repeat protein
LKLTCTQCSALFSIDDSLVVGRGIKAQCPACGAIQVVKSQEGATDTDTGPAAAPPMPERIRASPPPLPPLPPLSTEEKNVPAEMLAASNEPVQPPDRCERCGAIIPGRGSVGLCPRCQSQPQGLTLGVADGREWRVKKPDGIVLGPLVLQEVKSKFESGEVTAEDMVAQAEGEFRLISSFPEFSSFFRRPGEAIEMTFRHPPPSHKGRNLTISILVLLMLLGAAGWYYFTHLHQADKNKPDVLDEILLEFSKDIPNPSGKVDQLLAEGNKLMLRDDRLSYIRADKAFKKAMLLSSGSTQACAGWVQNRAMLDSHDPDVVQRKMALDLIDYQLERHPEQAELLRAKAYLYFGLNRISEARELANKALAKNDEDAGARLILGASYIDSNSDLAIEQINAALKQDPDLNVAARFLGEAYIRLGRFNRALRYFHNRLQKDPGQQDVLRAAAKLYLEVGQFAKAKEHYEMILAANPGNADALVTISRLYTQVFSKPARALDIVDRALEGKTVMPETERAQVLCERSIACRVMGKLDQARKSVDLALKNDPILVPALFARAVLDQYSGKVASCLQQLSALLTNMPSSARLRARLAEVRSQSVDLQKSLQEMKDAADLDQNDLDIVLMMAVMSVFLDDANQAYAWLKRSTDIDPFYAENHFKLTAYYDQPSLLRLSVKRAAEAAKNFGDDPLITSLYGAVLLRYGNSDQARSVFSKALSEDAECFAANYYMGVLWLMKNRPAQALPFLEKAHESNSLQRSANRLLARALTGVRKIKQALEIYTNILQSAPGDLDAHLGLAEVYLKQKRKKKAISELLLVYQRDPDNLAAKKLLFQLGR